MGASEKLPATFHSDDDVQPMGENPVLPPFMERALAVVGPNARSAAAAVFDAIAAVDDDIQRAKNLHRALNEVRALLDSYPYTRSPFAEIRAILERYGV